MSEVESVIAIAHRGNISGADKNLENSIQQISSALKMGFGLETDIRRSHNGILYISHYFAPLSDSNLAKRHAQLWRSYPEQVVALNIKELGYEAELLAFLEAEQVFGQVFLFDMELIEAVPGDTARLLRRLHPHIRLAARVSDRGESIDQALAIEWADIVWLDEFDHPWADEADIVCLKEASKRIYAVSPELHGFSLDVARQRWAQLAAWGVDGICTDWPLELARCVDISFRLPGMQG